MNERTRQDVRDECEPLIAQAERDGMWLWCHYQSIWFTPADLRAQQANQKFLWSVDQFHLRSPDEYIEQYEEKVATADELLKRARDKFNAWNAGR